MDFFKELGNIVSSMVTSMGDAVDYLDAVEFKDSGLFQFLGYFHYVMGSANYFAFTSVMLIGLGVTLWTYTLKGIDLIRSLLP